MTRTTALILSSLAIITLVALAACGRDLDEPEGGEVTIVTTIYPLTFIAERIGGDRVKVTQLVKPGIEAHDFEPAPSDIQIMSGADIFIFNHPSFEGWALNAIEAANSESVITVQAANLGPVGEGQDGVLDPHTWLDPIKAQVQATKILSALVAADPAGSFDYVRNADALEVELRGLNDLIAARLTGCALDTVVVSHLAYGHMAERYGFNQVGLAGLSPEFESGPAQIAAVIQRMNELGIKHILQEPIVSDRLAETVSAETGAEIVVLHPVGVRTVDEVRAGEDYISIMKTNADTLAAALQCG